MFRENHVDGGKPGTLVARRAAQSHGVLSAAELRACGLSQRAVECGVARGHLHRVHRGVYAVGHTALTPEGRWVAALKACGPGAVLSHGSAAMLLGLLPPDDRRIDVTVTGSRAHPGLRVHKVRSVPAEDTTRRRGIPTTTAARVLMDLAPHLGDVPLRRLMSRAQSMYLTNLRQLGRQLDRAQGRHGRARFARVLAARPPATRTELEDRVYDLVVSGGFDPPDVNTPLHIEGRRIIPDLRWPEQRLIVEADSRRWHDTPQARQDDADRQALLEAHGERLIRITWDQATRHAAQTLARIATAGAPERP